MEYDINESREKAQDRHDVVKDRQARELLASQLLEKINVHKRHSDGCDGNPSKAWCERCTAISFVGEILHEVWLHGFLWQRAWSHPVSYYDLIKDWTTKHVHVKK